MEDKGIYCYQGLTREEYLQDKVQLVNFEPIESNWEELFRWLMSVGRYIPFYDKNGNVNGKIADLWYNHVFTVLIEIRCNNMEETKVTFLRSMSSNDSLIYTKELTKRVNSWIERLNRFITQSISEQNQEVNQAIEVAKLIKDQLQQSISSNDRLVKSKKFSIEDQTCCNFLTTIMDIQAKGTFYLQKIEESGYMDAGLSLLLTFIRNYSTIIKRFNQAFSKLPDLYHDQILMVTPQKAIQDKAFLCITPVDPSRSFFLPAMTQFIAGEKEDGSDLIYHAEKDEYISGMQIDKVFTVFEDQTTKGYGCSRSRKVFKKDIDIHHTTNPVVLFGKENAQDYACGWMVESRIFLLREGEATIKIAFQLTSDSKTKLSSLRVNESELNKYFSLYVSDIQGWVPLKCGSALVTNEPNARLEFVLKEYKISNPFINASKEVHQLVSTYPVVRVLINNQHCPYDLATSIEFEKVQITLDVKQIRHVDVCTEMGEIDSSKPFYPFGGQAELGSWFRFGNEELLQKNLLEVEITGKWNKLPKTPNGYSDLSENWYEPKPKKVGDSGGDNLDPTSKFCNDSFKIQCEQLVEGRWQTCKVLNEKNNLFTQDENTKKFIESASIKLEPTCGGNSAHISGGYSGTSKEGGIDTYYPFRIILNAPAIGFGSEEYRRIFAERMIQNSSLPKEGQLPLPIVPHIPLWADIELSYKAHAEMDLTQNGRNDDSIRLSRVTALQECELNYIKEKKAQAFVEELGDTSILFLGVSNTLHKRKIRMYFDMAFIKQNLLEEIEESPLTQEWYYMDQGRWTRLDTRYTLLDETCSFTRSGFVEIELPLEVTERLLDQNRILWLRTHIIGDASRCLAVRCIYMDYISVIAENGDGSALPAMTIKQIKNENNSIKTVIQPQPGIGGKEMESRKHSLVRQTARVANRNRAVTSLDYEQLILERFPEIGKVCCLPVQKINGTEASDTHIVVFSYAEENPYPVTPTWKLTEIKEYISCFASPFARLKIINPLYQSVTIRCVAAVRRDPSEAGETMRRMILSIQHYYAMWIYDGTYPDLGKCYSYKALHSILANDKDVVEIYELIVDGRKQNNVDILESDILLCGNKPWSVLVPDKIDLQLMLYGKGIGNLMIGTNFKIF